MIYLILFLLWHLAVPLNGHPKPQACWSGWNYGHQVRSSQSDKLTLTTGAHHDQDPNPDPHFSIPVLEQ